MKRIAVALATVLAAGLGIVATPQTAQADVYTDPGYHVINGREWRTTCSPYSSTVERCRAEIKATQVKLSGGQFVEVKDWVFNNLTYKPSPRAQWKGNPLGNTGEWTAQDGRKWRTECDTPATGRNACRSYQLATVYAVKTMTPRTYEQRNQWVFNNIVLFSVPPAPTAPCNAAPLPSGFALTKEGRPYVLKAPYKPVDQYNPTSISNFIKAVITRYNGISDKNSQAAKDQKCLALLGADHLIKGSETSTWKGKPVRWFPYMFNFSANPTIADLTPPWHSGLAQGGVLGTFIMLNQLTGDAKWTKYGDEAFESFMVPISDPKGFVNRQQVGDDDFLWFEEYPTSPPTTVLNGHLEAVIGLSLWQTKRPQDTRIKALVDEAMGDLEPLLAAHEVDTDGGLLTSYDAVRGHGSAPLRLVSNNAQMTVTRLNDKPIYMPIAKAITAPSGSLLQNSNFTTVGTDGVPSGWGRLGSASNSTAYNGGYRTTSDGRAWQGLQQTIAAGSFTADKPLALTLKGNVTVPRNASGASGRIAVYSKCSTGTSLLYENVIRGKGWHDYTFGFTAPKAGCDLLFQLMVSPYTRSGTQVLWDDVVLRSADAVGSAADPDKGDYYDLFVWRTPTNSMTLAGSGQVTLQAYYNNTWQTIQTVTLTDDHQSVTIPERYTGRNVHLGYHESHVGELLSLYSRMGSRYPYLLDYARRWAPMAPSTGWQVPQDTTVVARTTDLSEITTADEQLPYVLGLTDQFTGLPYEELELLDEMQQPAK